MEPKSTNNFLPTPSRVFVFIDYLDLGAEDNIGGYMLRFLDVYTKSVTNEWVTITETKTANNQDHDQSFEEDQDKDQHQDKDQYQDKDQDQDKDQYQDKDQDKDWDQDQDNDQDQTRTKISSQFDAFSNCCNVFMHCLYSI